ncbi:MAG: tetratricopeptide repeat protein, partial [Candidatus Aminicenantes bacterium]|nr:tetratricopeptide repeat protein [Candidatus Aminicenantes bacterium]
EIGTRIYEVDFQYRSEKKFWNRKVIDDDRAEAHYFNNIGSEALLIGNYSIAEEFLRRSIDLDSSFSFAWTNLGVLLRKMDKTKEAEDYFKKAVMLDKKNHTAKMNLAGLYESQGFIKKSEKLKDQIKKILNRNPYYHFDLGVSEYNRENYRGAIDYFKRAIRRDHKKSEFYIKLSAAYYKLGDLKMSKKYLIKGQKYVESDQEKDKYQKKLEYIYIKLQEGRLD